jgi:hypothetical protein
MEEVLGFLVREVGSGCGSRGWIEDGILSDLGILIFELGNEKM